MIYEVISNENFLARSLSHHSNYFEFGFKIFFSPRVYTYVERMKIDLVIKSGPY